ncbi:MAG TPA: OmpA family protein [Bryobacteraceae bacterium]|nr:OmpA family protein [Bryobacteraceae bacterium]
MKALFAGLGITAIGVAALAQAPPQDPQPIYRVTVVSRSLEAVNYEHRGGPTPIDFQGTVLMPHAKGTAIVESHRGSVAIDAKLEHMEPPTRFGREYLTYVLWAISPEGRPKNLGELLVDSSNHAHLKATTPFQAFGLMVTAEPYYSVTIPSDVVVAENVVRPDTIGNRELVNAKYELMPRGQYTLSVQPAQIHTFAGSDGPKVSYDRYEAVLELYQAENAVQIARSLGADQYAADSMSRAAALLTRAQDMDARKMDPQAIVSAAREAAQMAEDARSIAVKRREEEHHAREVQQLEQQGQLRRDAEQQQAETQAQAEAAEARAEADAERARADAAEAQARAVRQATLTPQPPPPAVQQPVIVTNVPTSGERQARAQLLAQLNGNFSTDDSPRGLVITLHDTMFSGDGLRPDANQHLTNVAAILAAHPELNVRVEGYADTEALSREHAQAVRDALIARGARAGTVSAVGYGDSRPIASNATAAGRQQNRRVEVVITGSSIGNKALWDRGYRLQSER